MAFTWLSGFTVDGSVGIGVSGTPSSKLTVNESSTVTAAVNIVTARYGISLQGAGTSNSQYLLNLQSNGGLTDVMRVQSSGNVGIGTTSPAAGLQVAKGGTTIPAAGASTASAVFGNSTSDDNYGVAIGANSSGVGYISSQRTDGNATTYNLAVQPNGGNVGIGQDTPLNSLDIYRATGDASIRIQAETASASTILKFRNQNSDADITVDQTTSNQSRMVFNTDNTSGYVPVLSLEANRDTLMYGNVGIGTESPDTLLSVVGSRSHVSGDITISDSLLDLYNNLGTDTDEKGAILTFSDNYLGINKTTRAAIKGGTDTAGNTADGFLAFYTDSGGGNSVTERMRINHDGYVGIGTDNPTNKLQIKGDNPNILLYSDTSSGSIIKFVDQTWQSQIMGSAGTLSFRTGGANERMFINSSGSIKLNSYDSTNNTGTPTYLLGTDSSGNIVKTNTIPGSAAGPYLPLAGGTITGNLIVNGYIRAVSDVRGNGQQLVLNAGESYSVATGQTNELVYLNAENGIQINSSPDNWVTGWAGRKTAYINNSSGNSSFPGTINSGAITSTGAGTFGGNVTIGTSSDALSIIYLVSSITGESELRMGDTDTDAGSISYTNSNDTMTFRAGAATRMSIDSSGLDVTGTITVAGQIHGVIAGTANTDAVNLQQLNNATTGVLTYKGVWAAGTTGVTSAAISGTTITLTAAPTNTIAVGDIVTGEGIVGLTTTVTVVGSQTSVTVSASVTIAITETVTFSPAGGFPDLTDSARKVEGDYYITNVAGYATPNDAATTPNEWAVGDWCIFTDADGTDQWQKLDNSSTLDGAGTGGTLPLWSGTGTSVTLSDSNFKQTATANEITGITNSGSTYGLIVQKPNGTDTFMVRDDGVVSIPNNYLHVSTGAGSYFDAVVRARGGVTDDLGTLGLGGSNTTNNLTLTSNTGAAFSGTLTIVGNTIVGGTVLDNPQSWGKNLQVQNSGANGASVSVKDSSSEFNMATYGSKFYISEGSYERITIDTIGNVGIGANNPGAKLDVNGDILLGTTDKIGWRYSSGNISYQYITGTDQILTLTGGTWSSSATQAAVRMNTQQGQKVTLLNSGNFGIGTTSPDAKLQVNAATVGDVYFSGGTADIRFLNFTTYNTVSLHAGHKIDATSSNGEIAFAIGGSAKMYIENDGDVRITNLTAGNVVSSSTGVLSIQSLPANGQNLSLGEGYAANIREKYYRTGKTVYPSSVGYQYANLLQQGVFNDSSLLTNMVATETGTVNSDRPENGNGDFTFARNSPASRVGSDGYIEKERINYLLQSNSLDISPWGATDLSVAHGAIDPSGGNTAWTVTATAANGIIQQAVSLTNSRVFSIYAKSGSFNYLRIGGYGGVQSYASFNLSTGVSSTIGTNPNVAIENVGGGWYRCTVYLIGGTTGGVQIFPSNSASGNATSAGSVLLWNAQLEKGQAATEYISTTTVAVVEGVTANVPRIDYLNGVGELLLEPTSTNVVVDNSVMNQAVNSTLSQTISPEGVLSGIKVSETATTSQHYAKMISNVVSGTQYYCSFYVKKGTSNTVEVYLQSNKLPASISVNFSTEVAYSSTGTNEVMTRVSNGWYRVSFLTPAAIATAQMDIYMSIKNLSTNVGNVNNYTEYYGLQLETAPILTSVIPTYGSALTRANENIYVMNMNENNLAIGANSATLMLDFSFYYSTAGDSVIFRSDASQTGRGYLYARSIGFADTWGHSGFATTQDGVNTKVIWRVDTLSSGTFYKDGAKGNDVSGTAWADIGQINISGYYGTMRVRGIYFAPTALTNSQCATLTTITQ